MSAELSENYNAFAGVVMPKQEKQTDMWEKTRYRHVGQQESPPDRILIIALTD